MWTDFPRMMLKSGIAKLCSFFQSIAHNPSLVEEVLFNIAGDCFGVTLGLVRLVVVINIIRANAI